MISNRAQCHVDFFLMFPRRKEGRKEFLICNLLIIGEKGYFQHSMSCVKS